MAGILSGIVALGLLGLIAFLSILIVSIIKKKPKKVSVIGLVTCFSVAIVASLAYPDAELEDYRTRQDDKQMLSEQDDQQVLENSKKNTNYTDIELMLYDLKDSLSEELGHGEIVESIVLASDRLTINVDINGGDPSPFTFQDLAESRTASLTDELLRWTELDEIWNTVIIAFKEMGSIEFTKTDIVDGEFGRYFNIPINFKLSDLNSNISNEQQEQLDLFLNMIESVYNNSGRSMEDCADVMNQRNRVSPLIRSEIDSETMDKYEFISDEYFRMRDQELNDTETYVVLSQTGEKYHRSNCRTLIYAGTTATLQEAKNLGYGACGVCNPPES